MYVLYLEYIKYCAMESRDSATQSQDCAIVERKMYCTA